MVSGIETKGADTVTSLENLMLFYNATEQDSMYRSVLRILLTNLQRVGSLNIYELADLCYTSPSTISRLVRKMGYKGYAQFQSELSACVARYEHHNRIVPKLDMVGREPVESMLSSLEELYQAFRSSLDLQELDRMAGMMHRASRVLLFPYGVMLSENVLQSDLFVSGVPCDTVLGDNEQEQQAETMIPGELALVVSPDCIDAVGPLRRLVRLIRERGASLCLLCGEASPLLTEQTDLTVCLKSRQTIMDTYIMELYLAALALRYRSLFLDQ